MKIDYRIFADGEDITGDLGKNLVSLTVTDELGFESDTAEIILDNTGGKFAVPPAGARLKIALGFVGALTDLGTFVVDERSGDFFPKTLTISAKAADMRGGIKAPKTRNWSEINAEDILTTIAGEYDLKPLISESLKAHFFEYLAQTSESDLNLLTRIARQLDASFKPTGEALVVLKRGEGLDLNGNQVPVFPIAEVDLSGGSWNITGRGRFGKVTAEWSKLGSASVEKVTVGDDEPELVLKHRFSNQVEAERAAKAALGRAKRASGTINPQMAGFRPDLFAGANADLIDGLTELRGQWEIKRVTHNLAGKLTTSFSAERDNEADKS